MKHHAAAFLLALCGSAMAAPGSPDGEAREALARGDNAAVVRIYSASGGDLSDIAHYRLALALQRLNRSAEAWKHLQDALKLTPQGSFATKPERLQELRVSILAGCERQRLPQCEAAPVAEAPAPAEVATTPPSPVQKALPVAAPVAEPTAPAANVPNTAAVPAHGSQGGPATGGLLMALIPLQIACFAIVCWIAWSLRTRRGRASSAKDELISLGTSAARLITALRQSDEGRRSLLFRELTTLMPLIERESGKASLPAEPEAGALLDRRTESFAASLRSAPPSVLSASVAEVEAVFRRPANAQ